MKQSKMIESSALRSDRTKGDTLRHVRRPPQTSVTLNERSRGDYMNSKSHGAKPVSSRRFPPHIPASSGSSAISARPVPNQLRRSYSSSHPPRPNFQQAGKNRPGKDALARSHVISSFPRQRASGVSITFDQKPIEDPRRAFDPSSSKKKKSGIHRFVKGREYEPKASKSAERAFRKKLENNLNHETWIERMILDGDKPPIIYWQSLETKECYEEPPFGSYKTVHLDDIVLIRKPKPPMSQDRPLNAAIHNRGRQSIQQKTKLAAAQSKTRNTGTKATTDSNKRMKLKELKSKFGSFLFKSKKDLVEI